MPRPNATEAAISDFARRLLSADISRRKLFGSKPCSFVQWYIILELFIAESEGRTMVITDLIHLAGNPRSTTLKAIADLVASGVLMRSPDPKDRRRVFLALDPLFNTRVDELLLELQEVYRSDDAQ